MVVKGLNRKKKKFGNEETRKKEDEAKIIDVESKEVETRKEDKGRNSA